MSARDRQVDLIDLAGYLLRHTKVKTHNDCFYITGTINCPLSQAAKQALGMDPAAMSPADFRYVQDLAEHIQGQVNETLARLRGEA